jgi:hypothetical protein
MAELETLTKDELLAEDFICEYLRSTGPKKWAERYFYGLLSLTVTNAWKVFNMRKASRGERSVSIHLFLKQLARRCLHNPLGDAQIHLRPGTSTEELKIITQVRHGLLMTSQTGSNPKCVVCRSRGTSIKCICGAPVC